MPIHLTSDNPVPAASLAASYRHCEEVARTQARNFYFSFLTLPPEKKAAMCAIYAFMRYSDDLSDEEAGTETKTEGMRAWRAALDKALQGDYGDSLMLPAFHDTVLKYHIPPKYFYELIDGTEMDLAVTRYASWEDLQVYCYRVASVVGFVCLYVWGFDAAEGKALEYGEKCGLAFQLTNILRDVKEDIERDRIYLPQEDLRRFEVTEEMIREGRMDERFRSLMRFETERAEAYYKEAAKLLPLVHPDGQATLSIMMRIYHGILESIERNGCDVFSTRARVSSPRKFGIVLNEWAKSRVKGIGARG